MLQLFFIFSNEADQSTNVPIMPSPPSMPTLEDVAVQAAAGKEIQDYLLARGVRTAATLALIASDMDHLEKVLIKPLIDGWKVSDTEIIRISSSEAPIAAAVMQHMWSTCRNAWAAQQAAHATLSTPTLPTSTTPPSPGGGSSGSTEDKPPKQLPSGTWTKLLAAYESQQLGGRNRVFPAHELLGAETVLARIWWEHEKTKMYSAIGLGELLQVRTFLQEKGTSNLVISDNRLVQQRCWMGCHPSVGLSFCSTLETNTRSTHSLTGSSAWPGLGRQRQTSYVSSGRLHRGDWPWR